MNARPSSSQKLIHWVFLSLIATSAAAQTGALTPGGALIVGGTTQVYQDSLTGAFHLTWTAHGESVDYVIDPSDLGVANGVLRIREDVSGLIPIDSGGVLLSQGHEPTAPLLPRQHAGVIQSAAIAGNTLTVTYAETAGSVTLTRKHEYTIQGRSLKVHLAKTDTNLGYQANFVGTTFGTSRNAFHASRVIVPYMENMDVTVADTPSGQRLFYQTCIDFTVSSGAEVSRSGAIGYADPTAPQPNMFRNGIDVTYRELNDRTAVPLDETFWLTVSPHIEDVFVHVDNVASVYRQELNPTFVLNLSDFSPGAYTKYTTYLQTLGAMGVRNAMMYAFGGWAKIGQQTNLNTFPDLLPPNPVPGSLTDLQSTIAAARGLGYRIGLYSYFFVNTQDPQNSYYMTSSLVKDLQGNPKYFDTFLPYLAGSSALLIEPRIQNDIHGYGLDINLAYEDSLGWILPAGGLLSQYLPDGHNTRIRDGIATYKTLFSQDKQIHAGPFMSEGGLWTSQAISFDAMYAGYVDAWERHLGGYPGDATHPAQNDSYYVVPDYELKVVKPLATGLSFGFPFRFKAPTGGAFPYSPADADEIWATVLSYGHVVYTTTNGNLDATHDYFTGNNQIKAYYMLSASLQNRYMSADIAAVEYWDGSVFRKLSDVLLNAPAGVDLINPKLRLTYGNGLVIYVHHGTSPTAVWNVTIPSGLSFDLPINGWVASAPDGFLEFSAKPAGTSNRFDYVYEPNRFTMLDGRGIATTYHGVTSTLFHVQWTCGLTVNETAPSVFSIVGAPNCP